MALAAGTISVDGAGNATGTGLAIDIFNQALSAVPSDRKAQIAAAMAPFCVGLASAIVGHITAHAVVQVTIRTTDAGLQRLPATFVASADTLGPAADKTFTGSLT